MDLVNRNLGYPMLKLIEVMPDVAKVLTIILNNTFN